MKKSIQMDNKPKDKFKYLEVIFPDDVGWLIRNNVIGESKITETVIHIFYLSVVIVVSWLSFKLIEVPWRSFL